jgi:3-methylcrotonyl-CoA carboxylase alpha subunit
VRQGDAITPHYDPMIAKLVVWGEDRDTALGRLRAALAEYEIIGPSTNVAFLGRVASSKAFSGADLDTGLIERSREELFPVFGPASDEDLASAAAAELLAEEAQAEAQARASSDPYSPWHSVDGWRLNLGSHHELLFLDEGKERRVTVHFTPPGWLFEAEGRQQPLAGAMDDDVLNVKLGAAAFRVRAVRDGADWHLFRDGRHRVLTVKLAQAAPEPDTATGSLAAPMPGKVLQVLVQPGTRVARGTALVILEAMKMEHTISAPREGTVAEIHFKAGEQVNEGAELLRLS